MFLNSRDRYATKKIVRARRRRTLIYSIVTIVAIIALIAAFGFLSRKENILIHDITVHGATSVSETEIRDEANAQLSGTYFFLIPRRNSFVAPRKAIARALEERFKRIATAEVRTEGFRTLSITVTERQPYAVWCEGEVATPQLYSTSTPAVQQPLSACYFLDDTGYVFANAPHFAGGTFLKLFGPLSGEESIGSSYLSQGEFKNIFLLITTLKKDNIIMPVMLAATKEDIYLYTEQGVEIRFKRADDLQDVFNRMQTVFSEGGLSKEEMSRIEYIDLRFGNKVFYKQSN